MTAAVKPCLVLDTNVIVSSLLFKGEALRGLLKTALNQYNVVFSEMTWDELAQVMQRERFEKILPLGARLRVLAELASRVEIVPSTTVVLDCRDAKDTKFLSLALDAKALAIVSGDADLLVLHPYHGIAICAPSDFLHWEAQRGH